MRVLEPSIFLNARVRVLYVFIAGIVRVLYRYCTGIDPSATRSVGIDEDAQ